MVPPGSTNTSATLNYEYTYDGADNILSKKIPDQAWVNYVRDLLTFSQDGNLLAAGQWLNTQYDTYGRVIKSGLYTGNPANGDFIPGGYATQLTDNSYGVAGIEIGKVKTAKTRIMGAANDLSATFTYDTWTGSARPPTTM